MSKSDMIPDDELPQHLGHKPVYAMPYQFFDGLSKGHTDSRYLSVGLAQWNQDDVSIKIMRHTGNRWTRQAEELPLNRAIDMTSFLAHVLANSEDDVIQMKPGTFDNQTEQLTLGRDENRSAIEVAQFDRFMDRSEDFLKKKLNTLTDLLIELRSSGKL